MREFIRLWPRRQRVWAHQSSLRCVRRMQQRYTAGVVTQKPRIQHWSRQRVPPQVRCLLAILFVFIEPECCMCSCVSES